jgi:hypothetical protein
MARSSTCSSCRVNSPRSECAHDTEAVERSGAEDSQSLSLELVVGEHACGMEILEALKPVVDRVNVGRRVEDRVRRRGRLRAPTATKISIAASPPPRMRYGTSNSQLSGPPLPGTRCQNQKWCRRRVLFVGLAGVCGMGPRRAVLDSPMRVRTGARMALTCWGACELTCCVVVIADSAALTGAPAHVRTAMSARAANLGSSRRELGIARTLAAAGLLSGTVIRA